MLRIKAEDGAGTDPVTGKNIYVERLAPQISTYMRPYWANAVQEEIANTIEADGTVLNEADNKQLLRAVKFPHAIRTNLTLVYGTDFVNLNQAFDLLRGRYIAPGVTVTINLGSGYLHTIDITSPVIVDHPQGSQIQIIGDLTTPSNVLLNFVRTNIPGYRGAIEIAAGCTLGFVDGFLMTETYVATTSEPRYFFNLINRSFLKVGANVILGSISGSSIKVDKGSVLETGAATIRDFAKLPFVFDAEVTGVGILVLNDSIAYCNGIKMTNASNVGSYGIYVSNARLTLNNSDFSNSPVMLINASNGHYRNTNSHSVQDATGAFHFMGASHASLFNCKAGDTGKANAHYGFALDNMSTISCSNCTAVYSAIGFFLRGGSRADVAITQSNNNTVGYDLAEASYVGFYADGTGNTLGRYQKDSSSTIFPA